MKLVKTAWLFDVDGVLSNPQDKKVNPEIINEIVKILHRGEPVAIVTGRSINWLKERLVTNLASILNPNFTKNLFVSGEFGGISISYENEKELEKIDGEISVLEEIINKARELSNNFRESMFFDETKKTMVSVEMNDGFSDMDKFNKDREKLAQKFRILVEKSGKGNNFEVQEDTIAVNIRNKRANKKNSAAQVLTWLQEKELTPDEFICFGDSISDLEMGQEINSKGFKMKFVFVGKPEDLNDVNVPSPIIQTKELYDKGTLEYLKESDLS